MSAGILEHINITVSDPKMTAGRLCALFNWKIRWSGKAINGGHSVHVGSDSSYLAVYTTDSVFRANDISHERINGLNHVGVLVDDLDKVERRVIKAGFKPHSHGEYEPGRRFYFNDSDGLEFEVISYRPKPYPWRQRFFRMLGKMPENASVYK